MAAGDPFEASYWRRVRYVARTLLRSDGCTRAPDIWVDCCYEHDIAYHTGRTVEGAPLSKADADQRFWRCLTERSRLGRLSPAAWAYYYGVVLFGRSPSFVARPPRVDFPEIQALVPGALLESAIAEAKRQGELTASATTDGQSAQGEVAVTASGASWTAKLWARVTAARGAKPTTSAGVEVKARWFGSFRR